MAQRNKLISQKKAAEYCDLSISTLKRLRKIDDFPQPVQISERRIGYFLKLFCTKYSNSFVSKIKACLPLNVERPEEIQPFLII